MGKIADFKELIADEVVVSEKSQPASSAQKTQYQALNKEIDKLESEKEKLLDQLSKEADDDKRGKVQDALHACREKITGLYDKKRELMRKYRGLRSKD